MGIPGGSSKWDGYIGDITLEKTSRLEQIRRAWRFRGLDEVLNDLLRRGINIERLLLPGEHELGVTGNANLRTLLHPQSSYIAISRTIVIRDTFEGPHHFISAINIYGSFYGRFRAKEFTVSLSFPKSQGAHLDLNEGILWDKYALRSLERYFYQRMEAQQPLYNYTYRSRTEIK